jgi:hypothetical protein
VLFLSYAEEDGEIAGTVARSLRALGHEVYDWQDSRRQAGQFIREIESAIQQASGFLALLSPSFMASPWCRAERELAMQHEQDLQANDSNTVFVYVLKIAPVDYANAGFLRNYAWLDLHPSEGDALGTLAERLGSSSHGATVRKVASASIKLAPPVFRNRREELNRVLHGLENPAGPHFWLVIAPPQLGKTWFLDRISVELTESDRSSWVARVVDLREQRIAVRQEPGEILARMFGLKSPIKNESAALREIVQLICAEEKSHLCLLDSAELLDEQTASTLRSWFGQIYRRVQQADLEDVRLAVIVASRREDGWRGVHAPRFSHLALTEFKQDVVEKVLRDLAGSMRRNFRDDTFTECAELVHGFTEGLPALLVRCLRWIQVEQWQDLERLRDGELFADLAHPYIKDELLSAEGLGSVSQTTTATSLRCIKDVLRILVPYRLFTQSHLHHYIDPDPAFLQTMADAGWSIEDLWNAISGTALLVRPLDEPWQTIHYAIRRLLYRYYYKSDESRAAAHRQARTFVELWAAEQIGKEQVIGLMECLWHEACALSLTDTDKIGEGLGESARKLSAAIRPSTAYTAGELRRYAVTKMREDEEFQEAIDHQTWLLNRLAGIVEKPLP